MRPWKGLKLIPLLFLLQMSAYGSSNTYYVVNIKNAGTYHIWLRAKAYKGDISRLYISLDSGVEVEVTFPNNSEYTWQRVNTSYLLTAGSHKINIRCDAPGTQLDKILITGDANYTPTGVGGNPTVPLSMTKIWKVIELEGKGGIPIMGDLNSDGRIDFLVTGKEYISAYDNSGALLWQTRNSGRLVSYVGNLMVMRPYDIDGDGYQEAIGTIASGDTVYLAILNGMTGEIKAKIGLPPLSSSWNYEGIQIANLRGLSFCQDVVIKANADIFPYSYFKIIAYSYNPNDSSFTQYWTFNNSGTSKGVCHQPKVYDIDGDGRDEVLLGYWTLEEDGRVKWEKPDGFFDNLHHVDSIRARDIIPDHPGIEIAYSSGNVILDADGNLLWRKDEYQQLDGQSVALDEMRPELPGLEVLFAYQAPDNDERLFSSEGTLLWTHDGSSAFDASFETYTIWWIGDEGRECVQQDWGRSRSPSIYDEYGNLITRISPEDTFGEVGYRPCDVTGDYREELVCFNENYIVIYENIAPNPRWFPSPWNDPWYKKKQYNWVYY